MTEFQKKIEVEVCDVKCIGDILDAIQGHSSHFYDKKLFIFCGRKIGRGQNRSYSNEVHFFTKKNSCFKKVQVCHNKDSKDNTISSGPSVHCHVSCLHNKNVILIGGSGKNGYNEKIYKFNLEKKKWSIINIENKCIRHAHTCVKLDNKMYIFGGHYTNFKSKLKKRKFFNDIVIFNLENEKFEDFEISKYNEVIPKARSWSNSFLYKSSFMFVMMGFMMIRSHEYYYNDMFSLDLKEKKWKKVKQIGDIPTPRNRANLIKINENAFVLIGGNFLDYSKGRDIFYDDIYILKVISNLKVRWKKIKGKDIPKVSHCVSHYYGSSKEVVIIGGEKQKKNSKPIVTNDVTILKFKLL